MLPTTAERVPRHTRHAVNAEIQDETIRRIRYYASHPELIDQRLEDIDREWDIERTLEANAAIVVLAGVVLAAKVDRRWLVLPALAAGFLLQHALQGWCPPLPAFRRAAVRTMREMDVERFALKALRGDFADQGADLRSQDGRADHALRAAEL
jgi:hypothetical protein